MNSEAAGQVAVRRYSGAGQKHATSFSTGTALVTYARKRFEIGKATKAVSCWNVAAGIGSGRAAPTGFAGEGDAVRPLEIGVVAVDEFDDGVHKGGMV